MDKLFRILMWCGAGGGALAFWYAVLVDTPPLVDFFLGFFATIALFGAIGWVAMRGQAVLRKPDVAEKLDRAAAISAEVASEISDAGIKAADGSGRRVLPKLRYLFSFSGRVTRLEYLTSQVISGVILVVLFAFTLEDPTDGVSQVANVLALVVLASLLAFGARRTRDTGANQWWYLLILVPPVNLALAVGLLLVPTDEFRDAGI